MKKLSDNDLFLKIISIFIAMILWYIVLSTMNPIQTRTLDVPLNVLNENVIEENSYGMKNINFEDVVSVTVKGRQKDLENITKNDFSAVVDYAEIEEAGNHKINVLVSNKNEKISLVDYEPSSIEINVEEIIEKTFNVNVNTTGQVEEGYKLIDVKKSRETVTVKGYRSLIETIANVEATIDVSNLSYDKTINANCIFLDEDGNEIKAFENTEDIDISTVIGKKVSVNLIFEGQPAEGYYLAGSESKIKEIYIKGPSEIVSQINEVNSRAIVLTDKNSSFETDIEIVIPANVEIASLNGKMQASIEIEEDIEKTILVRSNDILLMNANYFDFIYEVVTDSLEIVIKAEPEIVYNTTKTDLNVLADVNDLTPGIHRVQLEIEIYTDAYITKEYEAVIRITERMQDVDEEENNINNQIEEIQPQN